MGVSLILLRRARTGIALSRCGWVWVYAPVWPGTSFWGYPFLDLRPEKWVGGFSSWFRTSPDFLLPFLILLFPVPIFGLLHQIFPFFSSYFFHWFSAPACAYPTSQHFSSVFEPHTCISSDFETSQRFFKGFWDTSPFSCRFEPVLQGCRFTLARRLPKYNDHQTLNANDCMNKSQRKCFFYNVLVSMQLQLCSCTLCEYF